MGMFSSRIKEAVVIIANALKLHNNNINLVVAWVEAPNPDFSDMSPYKLVVRGQGAKVIAKQTKLLSEPSH